MLEKKIATASAEIGEQVGPLTGTGRARLASSPLLPGRNGPVLAQVDAQLRDFKQKLQPAPKSKASSYAKEQGQQTHISPKTAPPPTRASPYEEGWFAPHIHSPFLRFVRAPPTYTGFPSRSYGAQPVGFTPTGPPPPMEKSTHPYESQQNKKRDRDADEPQHSLIGLDMEMQLAELRSARAMNDFSKVVALPAGTLGPNISIMWCAFCAKHIVQSPGVQWDFSVRAIKKIRGGDEAMCWQCQYGSCAAGIKGSKIPPPDTEE